MAIAYTQQIQGPDANVTAAGYDSLAHLILAAREAQRQKEQARAQMLLQERQQKALEGKWSAESAAAQTGAVADRIKAEASKLREQRDDRRYTDESAAAKETRTRAQTTDRERLILAARAASDAGDAPEAARLHRLAGGTEQAPEMPTERIKLDRRITMDPIAIERGGKTGPVTGVSITGGAEQDIPTGEVPTGKRYAMPDGSTVTDDPAARKAAAENVRLEKIAKALAPYADMATEDPDIAEVLKLTKKRVMAGRGDADTDKALDDLGTMVSKIQGDRSAEKRSRISAAARPNTGERPAEVKAAGFADRIGKQREIIESAGGMSPEGAEAMRRDRAISDVPVVGWAYRGLKGVIPALDPKSNMSERDRAVANATAELSAANLRNESGGAITEGEERSNERRLMRDPSDTDEDWARKVQAMRDLENAALRQAGLPTKLFNARAHSKSRADRLKNSGKSLSELSDEEFVK